jgi:hypothetical protein
LLSVIAWCELDMQRKQGGCSYLWLLPRLILNEQFTMLIAALVYCCPCLMLPLFIAAPAYCCSSLLLPLFNAEPCLLLPLLTPLLIDPLAAAWQSWTSTQL